MLHIKIMGNYKSEDDLTQGKTFPHGAVPFQEGDSLQDAFIKGFLVGLPLIIPMVILTILKCKTIDYSIHMDVRTILTFAVMLAAMFPLTYIHELLHVLFYSKEVIKTIWKSPKQGAYFVYCDAFLSKKRFVVLCVAPAVILGIIPFIIWYISADHIAMPYSLAVVFTTWVMTIMAIGDYANIYNCIRQIPKGAKVFNYGMHSYWIR